MECKPQELLPSIPPNKARLAVEVSGPKNNPDGSICLFRSSRIIPGSIQADFSFLFNWTILDSGAPTSITIPSPTTWPAKEVPAPRGMILVLCFSAN